MLLSPQSFDLRSAIGPRNLLPSSSRLQPGYDKAPRGAVMSLCTSIPATRSYSTFIRPATSCSGTPPPMGQGAPPARAPGQNRSLTHAHAGRRGLPGKELQHQFQTRPRTVHRSAVTTGGPSPTTVHLPPPPAPKDPGQLRPAHPRGQNPVFVSHGSATQWPMIVSNQNRGTTRPGSYGGLRGAVHPRRRAHFLPDPGSRQGYLAC